jgi:hypothetical protein
MAYDLYAMYLSHYYRFQVKGHEDYKRHSLSTVNSFVRKEFLLVLHHIALLTVLLPVTLVRHGGTGRGREISFIKAFHSSMNGGLGLKSTSQAMYLISNPGFVHFKP